MSYERLRDFYRAGWRPALGWVIVAAFFCKFVLGRGGDVADLLALLTAGGGLVGVRAAEKMKGAG